MLKRTYTLGVENMCSKCTYAWIN